MWCHALLADDSSNTLVIKGLGIDEFMMNIGAGSYSFSELLLATEVFEDSTLTEMKEHFESLFLGAIKSQDVFSASHALYRLVTKEMGSRLLITSMLDRVMSDS